MKATIDFDVLSGVPTLHGALGVPNAPYTAQLQLERPDGKTDTLVVPSTDSDAWQVTLERYAPGSYSAVIQPREDGKFEASRRPFTL
ncbi:hypothetical protein ACSMEV_01020 [Pseudomonas sp. MLB6B]